MTKQEKLKYINELIYVASGWTSFYRDVVTNFINEARFKIEKICGSDSHYVTDIDVLSQKSESFFITDWQEQIITVLNKLKFEIETTEEIIETKGKVITIHCNKCSYQTNHFILFSHTEREINSERIGLNKIDLWLDKTIQLLKCGGCNEYTIKKHNIWSESAPNYPEIDIEFFPKRLTASIKSPNSFKNIPTHIVLLYQEVIVAFTNDLKLLCAGGLRAIIEAICIDKGIKNGLVEGKKNESLKGRINGLCEAGFLTEQHSKILIHHQFIGDKALHNLETPSSEELEIAIDIIAHTLSSIYELNLKGKELESHIEKRKKA